MAEQQPPTAPGPPDQPLPPPVAPPETLPAQAPPAALQGGEAPDTTQQYGADMGAPTEASANLKKKKSVIRIGVAVLFVAGALTLISSFLPWITVGGESVSGWKIMREFSRVGNNPIATGHFYQNGGLFFTGLCTFIAGLLLMALAIIVFVNLLGIIGRIAALLAMVLTSLIGIMAIFNWHTIAITGRNNVVAPGTGVGAILLIVSFVVAIVGLIPIVWVAKKTKLLL